MSEKREQGVRGIVIASRPAGEGSVRVYLYTDALGLIAAIAKSAREEHSKLRAHLVQGTVGTYALVKGKDVWRVTGAWQTRNIYFGLSREAAGAVARVLSTVRQFIRGEGSDPYLFATLWHFLIRASDLGGQEIKDAECAAVFRLLSALGYVSAGSTFTSLLNASYDPVLLKRVHEKRSELVRLINEGMAISGL